MKLTYPITAFRRVGSRCLEYKVAVGANGVLTSTGEPICCSDFEQIVTPKDLSETLSRNGFRAQMFEVEGLGWAIVAWGPDQDEAMKKAIGERVRETPGALGCAPPGALIVLFVGLAAVAIRYL